MTQTVAVDFDGVLHPYTRGWIGSVPDNEPPIPGALRFVQRLIDHGYEVVVFTTRADHDEGRAGVETWLAKWFGGIEAKLRVTHEKPPAIAYVDDRAVTFRRPAHNWNECLRQVDALAIGRPHGSPQ